LPDTSYEDAARKLGFAKIAGVDEAGRGPWAGPVVAGAAVLDLDRVPNDLLNALDDSKKLKPHSRAALFEQLTDCPAVRLGVGISDVADIDIHNILQATMMAMAKAVSGLPVQPDYALVDGNREPILPCPLETIVKGDGKSVSIAAGSIIAKVTRDKIMSDLALEFPGYGWETNAGYGTPQHQTALRHLGVTPHHRQSFKPIQEYQRR
jgi:ribonuclease HII